MSDELLPKDWEGKPVQKTLLEDLADVLAQTVVGWTDVIGYDLSEAPEVQRVMARFRLEREDAANWLRWGKEVEDDCHLWGNCLHQRIQSEIHRIDAAGYQIKLTPPPKPPQYEYTVTYQCRKCGGPIRSDQYRFGSPNTGWEHMDGECQ